MGLVPVIVIDKEKSSLLVQLHPGIPLPAVKGRDDKGRLDPLQVRRPGQLLKGEDADAREIHPLQRVKCGPEGCRIEVLPVQGSFQLWRIGQKPDHGLLPCMPKHSQLADRVVKVTRLGLVPGPPGQVPVLIRIPGWKEDVHSASNAYFLL